jgi:hypothetical protein
MSSDSSDNAIQIGNSFTYILPIFTLGLRVPKRRIRFLILELIVIIMLAVSVDARNNAFEVIVGTATVKPSINGQWQQYEWDDAAEYKLTVGSGDVINRPYIRLEHDNDTLYGLVDVPSDNGGFYVDSNSQINWGQVLILFYYGARFDLQNTTQAFTAFQISTNQTHLAHIRVVCRCSDQYARVVSSHSSAALSLSSTIHYAMKHIVWEFSIQMYPYVLNNTLNSDSLNSTIGFTVAVVDSFGHAFLLTNLSEHAEMIFTSPVAPQTVLAQDVQAGVSMSLKPR